ncbi:hypothetical protein GCM10009853_072680 [Glycomyces scopariae]
MDDATTGLLSVRAAVIMLAAIVFGLISGAVHYLEFRSVAEAVLTGLAILGGSVTVLHRLIERRRPTGTTEAVDEAA